MEELNNVSRKQKKNLGSIIFLILVVLLTVSLHFYNSNLKNDITKIKSEISSYNSNIKNIEKDKKIQIYSLLQLNNNVIRGYKLMNKIPTYINHLNDIQTKYDIKFTGFILSDLGLDTIVEVKSDDKAIAYQKARDFIKNYRKDPDALFNLDFINQISGMDNIKFKVHFKIKG